jgi:hypothetical protein
VTSCSWLAAAAAPTRGMPALQNRSTGP